MPTGSAKRVFVFLLLVWCSVMAWAQDRDRLSYSQRPEVLAQAPAIAALHGLDASWVEHWLAQAQLRVPAQRLMTPPAGSTGRNWSAYRARFIEPVRLRAGERFWQSERRWLDKAQARYGVPPELVVGIIGVETLYGRHMGRFRVLDVLTTLAFDFPQVRSDRSAFFLEELGHFLRLCRDQGVNPDEPLGSFAGAMGMGQFMPSSWQRWAVDFDGDGRIDLHHSAADVIGSIANFLVEHGWTPEMPTHFPVTPPLEPQDRAHLLAPDIIPSFTPDEFLNRGAELPPEALRFPGLLALVELQNGSAAPSHVAGTANFFTVTRYNRSSYYALAVIELGEAIRERVSPQARRAAPGVAASAAPWPAPQVARQGP